MTITCTGVKTPETVVPKPTDKYDVVARETSEACRGGCEALVQRVPQSQFQTPSWGEREGERERGERGRGREREGGERGRGREGGGERGRGKYVHIGMRELKHVHTGMGN